MIHAVSINSLGLRATHVLSRVHFLKGAGGWKPRLRSLRLSVRLRGLGLRRRRPTLGGTPRSGDFQSHGVLPLSKNALAVHGLCCILNPMNPFTKSLATKLGASKLQAFIAHWDALEQLVIRVFRGKVASEADETAYTELRIWLQANYAEWQVALQPHWQLAKIAGQPATEDPFAKLFAPAHAADFLNNWPALQALPAAREGLNRLVLGMEEIRD